ncbi:MAG: transposase [Verrucomicrobia bacterium]|nr:transposase [Verrucomicrobiota bacterium]
MHERIRRRLLSQLLCLGRHTLTGVLGTSGRLFCDWSADYRMYSSERVEPEKLFAPVRQSLTGRLAVRQPLVAALDDTHLRKSGRKTHGVKYTRDPLGPAFHINFIKAQRFLQISMASPAENGMARMVSIDFVHAPAAQKPRPGADEQTLAQFRQAKRETALPKVGAERLSKLRSDMDQEGQVERPLWSVVDGGYTNRTFIKNLPERTTAVGRIRADAKLYHLPESTEGKPGRHRVYGERAPTPEELRQNPSVPWQHVEAFAAGKTHHFKIKTLTPLRWRSAGKEHQLRLIVIAPLGYRLTKGGKMLYRKPAYLICTDPNASIEEILQAYLWRWDIEVNFRDEKTLLGVGQAQVRHEQSVEKVPALAVAAYAMLLTSAINAYGPTGKPDSLPTPKWRNKETLRPSTQSLLQHLRHEVWAEALRFYSFASPSAPDTKPQKLETTLESVLFYAVA